MADFKLTVVLGGFAFFLESLDAQSKLVIGDLFASSVFFTMLCIRSRIWWDDLVLSGVQSLLGIVADPPWKSLRTALVLISSISSGSALHIAPVICRFACCLSLYSVELVQCHFISLLDVCSSRFVPGSHFGCILHHIQYTWDSSNYRYSCHRSFAPRPFAVLASLLNLAIYDTFFFCCVSDVFCEKVSSRSSFLSPNVAYTVSSMKDPANSILRKVAPLV